MNELIEKFKLSDVHKAGAIFDEDRMAWFNAEYIKSYELETLWNKIKTYLSRYDNEYLKKISEYPEDFILKILWELQTRMRTFNEFKTLTEYFFEDIADLSPDLIVNPKMKVTSISEAKISLEVALELLSDETINLNNPEEIKQAFIDIIKSKNMKNGQVLWPVRVWLSMQQFSPWALELVYIFGREKSIQRISKVLKQM